MAGGVAAGLAPQEDVEEDWNTTPEKAQEVVRQAEASKGQVALVPDLAAAAATVPRELWEPFLEDPKRRSFSYLLRREAGVLTSEELSGWFEALHPRNSGVGAGAWTGAAFQGQSLLRKTAWYVQPPCRCAYDYADTHQDIVTDERFCSTLQEITRRVAAVCGVAGDPPNSCNLNYYPTGGGVGWHSDDEPLFDGLRRDVAIISLSLTEKSGEDEKLGSRWFEVRMKRPFAGSSGAEREVRAVELRHGDLMTMEGLFQLHYLHSAWPGDRKDILEAPGRSALGERINLTWRWVVCHTAGCPAAEATAGGPGAAR